MSSTARGLTPASEEQFMAALMRGGEMLASGQLMEARDLLEQAQSLDPKHEKALNLLGLTYFKLGNFPRAAEIYEALVNDNPADATLRVNLGLVYLKANDVQRSVKEFETATDLEPEHKKAHNYLGLALAQAGEFARAKEHFVQAGSDAMADKMAKALAAKASEPATITLNQPKAPPPPPPAAEPPPLPPPTRAQLAPQPPPPGEAIEVMSDEEVPPMAQDDSVEIEVERPSAPPAPIATDWGQQLPPSPSGPPPADEPPMMEASVAPAEEPPLMADDAAVVEASVEPASELPPSAEDPRWAQGAPAHLSASETSMYANPYADAPVMEATVDAPPAEPAWLAQPMGEVNLTRAQAHAQVAGVDDAPPMVVTAVPVEDAEYVEAQAEPPAVVPTSQPMVEHEALLTGGQAVLVVENAHEAGTEVEVAPAAAAPSQEDELDFGSVNEAVGATPVAPPPPSAPLPVTVEEPPLELEPKRPAARVEPEPEPEPAPLVLEKRPAAPAPVAAPPEAQPEPEPRTPPDQQGFAPMRAPRLLELGASTQWVAEPSSGTFHISNEGLAISVNGEMLTRMTGLVAIVGSLDATPEVRRARGRALDQPFGAGATQMQRVKGNGVLYLEVGKSRFHAFDIDDEAAYLREERLFAFEEPISYENGRLSTDGGHALDLVHLTGKGRVLVQLDGNLKAMPIPSGNPMVVPLGRVVGWFGHVNPRLKVFAGQASVELTGEGFVLLGAAAEK